MHLFLLITRDEWNSFYNNFYFFKIICTITLLIVLFFMRWQAFVSLIFCLKSPSERNSYWWELWSDSRLNLKRTFQFLFCNVYTSVPHSRTDKNITYDGYGMHKGNILLAARGEKKSAIKKSTLRNLQQLTKLLQQLKAYKTVHTWANNNPVSTIIISSMQAFNKNTKRNCVKSWNLFQPSNNTGDFVRHLRRHLYTVLFN